MKNQTAPKNMLKLAALIVTALLLHLPLASAASEEAPDPATEATFKKMMKATIDGDFDAFVADCDATMKAAITKEKLQEVSKLVAPRLKPGYETLYFGGLKQHGYAVHLWRVHGIDGGDDFLATLSLMGDKVGGFYLH